MDKASTEKKVDKAVDLSFPASDATAHGKPTSTEPPARPIDRHAPVITREQIEQAQRGEGHKQESTIIDTGSKPVDRPDQETVEVRQGTGPRATVSVLMLSLVLAGLAGMALVGFFVALY